MQGSRSELVLYAPIFPIFILPSISVSVSVFKSVGTKCLTGRMILRLEEDVKESSPFCIFNSSTEHSSLIKIFDISVIKFSFSFSFSLSLSFSFSFSFSSSSSSFFTTISVLVFSTASNESDTDPSRKRGNMPNNR